MKREYDRDKYIVRVNVIIDIGNDRKKFHNLLFIKKSMSYIENLL